VGPLDLNLFKKCLETLYLFSFCSHSFYPRFSLCSYPFERSVSETVMDVPIGVKRSSPLTVPSVIREILFVPEAPPEIASLLEVSITYHNTSEYELAIQTLSEAEEKWILFSKECVSCQKPFSLLCS
jgi:hypothetical protein